VTTLRLIQSVSGPANYGIEATLEDGNLARQSVRAEFRFTLTSQDLEDLRWYLEDYLRYCADPAPKIAVRIERRMAEVGRNLFSAVFEGSDAARDLWATLRGRLQQSRIEIVAGAGVREPTMLPWELLRDPGTEVPLILQVSAFVRTAHQLQGTRLSTIDSVPLRILLVISRPLGSDDVPFRSVAASSSLWAIKPAWDMNLLYCVRPLSNN
jgi:hypothetical protein